MEEHIQQVHVTTPQLNYVRFPQVNFVNMQSKACSFKG